MFERKKSSDLQVDGEAQNHEVSFETQRVKFLRHTEEALEHTHINAHTIPMLLLQGTNICKQLLIVQR